MNGIFIVGEIISKEVSTFKMKDGKEGTNYEITILDSKYTRQIRTDKTRYMLLMKGEIYTMPIGMSTFLYGKTPTVGTSYFIREGHIVNEEGEMVYEQKED